MFCPAGDMDDVLEKVVALFGHISDKDLFQEFYRKQLSRRLLMSGRATAFSPLAVLGNGHQIGGKTFGLAFWPIFGCSCCW